MKTEIFTRERTIAFLAFLWLFILMTGYYVVKPLREALVNELPTKTIPYLSVTVMIIMLFFNFIYDHLASRPPRNKLITKVTIFFAACILIFATGLKLDSKYISLPFLGQQPSRFIWITGYYIFVGIYNVFTVTMFWAFVNDMFKPEEARNCFGYITAGGTIGGIVGSKFTHFLSTKIQVENLLYFASLMLILTLICMELLFKLTKDVHNEHNEKEKSPGEDLIKNGFHLIWKSSYLKWMLIASFLTSSGATLLYNLMNAIVKYNITDKALRTAYWADVYQWINIFGLIFQLFGVYLCVRYLGMLPALLVAPLTDLTGSLLLIPSQTLLMGRIYNVGHFSTEYSFNRASSEMLYTPTGKSFKYQAKAIIDTFICRLGEGITNLMIIFTGLSLQNMVFLSFAISLVRIFPAIALVKHYKVLTNKNET